MENDTAAPTAAPEAATPETAPEQEAHFKEEFDPNKVSVELTLDKKTKLMNIKIRGQKASDVLRVIDMGRRLIVQKIAEQQPKVFNPHKAVPS